MGIEARCDICDDDIPLEDLELRVLDLAMQGKELRCIECDGEE